MATAPIQLLSNVFVRWMLLSGLVLVAPVLWAASVPSAVLSGVAVLEHPEKGGLRAPREALRLRLEDDALARNPSELTVELGGMDVTAMVRLRGRHLIYVPVRPLTSGRHELRLMVYRAEGDVEELGHWLFEVRTEAPSPRAEAQGYVELAIAERFAARPDGEAGGQDDTWVQGSGQMSAQVQGERWQLATQADLMIVDNVALAPANRRADLTRWSLRAALDERYAVTLGDQSLGRASLIQDGFERRGISASAQLTPWDAALSVYRAGARQQPGLEARLGLDEPDDQLSGGTVSFWPLRGENARVYIAGSHLEGRASAPDYGSLVIAVDEGSFDDSSLAPPDAQRGPAQEGSAWNVVMDGQFFQRQWRLRLENARTEYDFDGAGFGFEAERDSAWSALLVYDPRAAADETDWQVGLEAKKIGTYFRSVADRYAPADKRMERVFFQALRRRWQWDGYYAVENNNLDDDADYATSESHRWNVSASYQGDPEGFLGWLGQPRYRLSASGSTLEDDYTPTGYWVNDLATRRYHLSAGFTRSQWQWSLGYERDSLNDNSGWQPDASTDTLLLDTGFYFNADYYISTGWQWLHTRYDGTNVTEDQHLYSVNAGAGFIPDVLTGTLSLGLNQTSARDDPFRPRSDQFTYLSAELAWQIRQPAANRFGWQLSLSLSRNDWRDHLTSPIFEPGYQVFIELRTLRPITLPGGTL
ncbi:hypothetical protein [Marinimicrobium sp. ARAG 43.8]|uniref:hypothetical protein n=1 Tax=Marinimicrobium sp. ARAG 43.8 TaxID=3418719 RepID=UPI003CF9ABC5